LNLKINKLESNEIVNKTLSSIYNEKFVKKTLIEQINDIKFFIL